MNPDSLRRFSLDVLEQELADHIRQGWAFYKPHLSKDDRQTFTAGATWMTAVLMRTFAELHRDPQSEALLVMLERLIDETMRPDS